MKKPSTLIATTRSIQVRLALRADVGSSAEPDMLAYRSFSHFLPMHRFNCYESAAFPAGREVRGDFTSTDRRIQNWPLGHRRLRSSRSSRSQYATPAGVR